MSQPVVRFGDLEINQDLKVQARMWRLQRVGWATMLTAILLALAGLFGGSPAGNLIAGEKTGPLWVEYERFGRYQSSSQLRVHLRAPSSGGRRQFWIDNSYLRGVAIQQIWPHPAVTRMSADGLLFEVEATEGDAGVVTVSFQFERIGPLSADVRSPGGPSIRMNQFVYP